MNGRTIGRMAPGAALALALLAGGAGAQQQQQQPSRGAKIETEGVVSQRSGTCPNLSIQVGGMQFVTDARTEFDDGTCDQLTEGQKVEIEGRRQPDGTIRAHEVDFDD